MNIGGEIELKGFDELAQKLESLPRVVQGKIARPAQRAGAKVIQAAAVAKAPRRTGLLARSIKVRAMRRSRTRVAGAMVTTNEGTFAPKGKAFYAYFQERGWRVGRRKGPKSKVQSPKSEDADTRKFIEGKHFLRDAFEEAKQEAAEVIEKQIAEGIEAALKP